MRIEQEDKVSLAAKRAELVQILVTPMSNEDRVRIQGELAVINAKIKAINTTTAAQLKAAADRRKAAGLAEAHANTTRARAHLNGSRNVPPIDDEPEDDDPRQTAAIDGWIDAVLLRHDVDFTRSAKGALAITSPTVPPKIAAAIELLVTGICAAARGEELPDLPPAAPKAPAPKAKPKKR